MKKFKKNEHYTFKSIIPFIIGTVVGIGSYFKIGKILKATGGNATSAIITWLISIVITGSAILVISSLMSSTKDETKEGGFVKLFENYTSVKMTKYLNSLLIYLFAPIMAVVESVVASKFLFSTVLNIHNDLILIISTVVLLVTFFIANGKSISFGKVFQSGSLIIKLIPLSILIVLGLIFKPFLDSSHFYLFNSFTFTSHVSITDGILAATPATLFAMDGWQWSTTIASETKGGAKVYVKALLTSLVVISLIYISYTLGGLSVITGSAWASGDHGNPLSIATAFSHLFNSEIIAKVVSTFIVIAALGGLNAYTVFYNRQIKAASDRNWLPKVLSLVDEKTELSFNSSLFALFYSLFTWGVICGSGYLFPEFFDTFKGSNFDVTASISIASDVLTCGLFNLVYIILAVLAFKKYFKNLDDKTFKLSKPIFYITNTIMMVGGIFGVYVNFKESPILYLIGVVYLIVLTIVSPNQKLHGDDNTHTLVNKKTSN